MLVQCLPKEIDHKSNNDSKRYMIYNLVYIWHYANQDHHKKTDVHAGNFFFGAILYQAIAHKIGHIKP